MKKTTLETRILNLTKKLKRYPNTTDLQSVGITRNAIRHAYGNMSELKELLRNSGVLFDATSLDGNILPNTKRFVITTAVADSKVHKGFLDSINTYCDLTKSELVILPATVGNTTDVILDDSLRDCNIITQDIKLNDNISIVGLKSNAKKTDPVTGLPRLGKRNSTFIVASPKQRLKYVANGLNCLPHAIMSTGAITTPDYIKDRRMVNQVSLLAEQDHKLGALIVELDANDTYHFRQIQADKSGAFCDMGLMYKKNRVYEVIPEAFILGDWHSGSVDTKTKESLIKLTKRLNPKRWVIHDLFDGRSITHHEENKVLLKAKRANNNELDLSKELNGVVTDITEMLGIVNEVVVVKSNHDEHLDRYLEDGRFLRDHKNFSVAIELSDTYLKTGVSPLESYVNERLGKLNKRVTWLMRDEDYTLAGCQLGAHGDKGANGSKGTIKSLEEAYGDVIFGHSHTPQILRDAWCVGTTSKLELGYNVGPSSWMNTSAILYPNGQRQLINFIKGKYTTLESI